MTRRRILLIEPDKVLGNVYKDYFQSFEYEVIHVLHAQDAIHASDMQTPDVVVLELQLANHNGIEFLHEFRSYAEWSDIPIVIHTLVPPDFCRVDSFMRRDFGIEQVLYKPATSLKKLRRAIDDVSRVFVET